MKNHQLCDKITLVTRAGIFLTTLTLISCVSRPTPAAVPPPDASPPADEGWEFDCGSHYFPAVSPGATVMLLGDSLAVGMEPQFISLARRGGYVPLTHVVSGTSIFQWIKWIRSDLERAHPELVVISLGTNDAIIYDRVRAHSHLYRDLNKIVEDSGATIVWLGPPGISPGRVRHIDATREIIKDAASHYFEPRRGSVPLGRDGIHSTHVGYNGWMGAAWEWMIERNILTKSAN